MSTIIPVILCGGSGTRLWPISREDYPKQFISIDGCSTLFESTLNRLNAFPNIEHIIVVCNEKHKFYIKNIVKKYTKDINIILEPNQRDTAAAIALAALLIEQISKDSVMLVLPADHAISNDNIFCESILDALYLAKQNYILTFGVKPLMPEIGFGYIEQGSPIGIGYTISRFIEKPDINAANKMIKEGTYLWNSGIYLMRSSIFLRELKLYEPEIESLCRSTWENHREKDSFFYPDNVNFTSIPAKSVDYAIMERTSKAVVFPLRVEWNDLGSWERIYQISKKDDNNNVISGDVILEDSNRCYVNSRNRLVAAIGVNDLSIIETQDAILISPRKKTQDVKKVVQRLKELQRSEYKEHTLVYRPWGSYEALVKGERFQVKRIIVNPGEELSLQLHHHRAEHWIIVSGTAEVTNGDKVYIITENQSTFIPIGTVHRLKNPGIIPLILIEIQSGAYLGEDDIVRLADIYDRD